MTDTWFCSDHHFGHKKILEFEKEARPFNTIEEMNECIIERHNSVVKPNDVVYCLGDFAFGKSNILLADRLNGVKKLVLGNHDSYPSSEYLKYFRKLYGVVFWHMATLTHVPVHMRSLMGRSILNVHGHLHSKKVQLPEIEMHMSVDAKPLIYTEEDRNYLCVSLEQNNLYPFHESVIRERLKELE